MAARARTRSRAFTAEAKRICDDRAGNRCQSCGVTEPLQYCHIYDKKCNHVGKSDAELEEMHRPGWVRWLCEDDEYVSSDQNAVRLCSRCHDLVDKSQGYYKHFSVATMEALRDTCHLSLPQGTHLVDQWILRKESMSEMIKRLRRPVLTNSTQHQQEIDDNTGDDMSSESSSSDFPPWPDYFSDDSSESEDITEVSSSVDNPSKLSVAYCPVICYCGSNGTHKFLDDVNADWKCEVKVWNSKNKNKRKHYQTGDKLWWTQLDKVELPWLYFGTATARGEPIEDYPFDPDQDLQLFISVMANTYKYNLADRLVPVFRRFIPAKRAEQLHQDITNALTKNCAVLILLNNSIYRIQLTQPTQRDATIPSN